MLVQFIMMTLAFTVGTLIASGLSMIILLNTKIVKWYMKKVSKISNEIVEDMIDNDEF